MLIEGLYWLERQVSGEEYQIKAIFNSNGILFGPVSREHSTLGGGPVNYKDSQKGNALAAMIMHNTFEIRYDKRFPPMRLRKVIDQLSQAEDLAPLSDYEIIYQGKPQGLFRSCE